MRKILYSALSLFVVWFASTACFPIYVGSSRPELAPCQPVSEASDDPGTPHTPCIETEPITNDNETVSL